MRFPISRARRSRRSRTRPRDSAALKPVVTEDARKPVVTEAPASQFVVLGTDDPVQHALQLACGYLNRRDLTQAEVRRRLEQRGVESSAVEAALATLIDQGMLDDARYARLFVEDKRGLEQWGNERIRRTLQERGIERELIDQVVETDAAETELDRALALLRRRFSAPPQDRRERDRALGVLLRKGYDFELALDALAVYASDASNPRLR